MAVLLIVLFGIAIFLMALAATLGTYFLPGYLLKRFAKIDVEARPTVSVAYMIAMAPIAACVGLSVALYIIVLAFFTS
jgi:Kef-type K+ transport system membrane component KefB